jgi:hypothetical protein
MRPILFLRHHTADVSKGGDLMAIDTHDAVTNRASLAARVRADQAPFLLVALTQWREIQRRIEEDAAMVAAEDLSTRQRREILDRLNTLDAGPTEDDRRAEREAGISKAGQTVEALAREGRSAGGMWGFFGRSAAYR